MASDFSLSHRDIEDLLAQRGIRRFKSAGQAQLYVAIFWTFAMLQPGFSPTGQFKVIALSYWSESAFGLSAWVEEQ